MGEGKVKGRVIVIKGGIYSRGGSGGGLRREALDGGGGGGGRIEEVGSRRSWLNTE